MPVPPAAVMEMEPLLESEHVVALAEPLMVIPDGAVMVKDALAVHAAASETVTE